MEIVVGSGTIMVILLSFWVLVIPWVFKTDKEQGHSFSVKKLVVLRIILSLPTLNQQQWLQ